jgi:hypothetical protein
MIEQFSPDEQNRDVSTVLWETIQTFSDEAQSAAQQKGAELGFSFNRGKLPFEETLINLKVNRDLLIAAVKGAALPQLPLKIQNQLLSEARRISTHLAQLTNGIDSIVSLESAVDDLSATIWYSNLRNLSGRILDFHKKQNELKSLETTLRALARRANDFTNKEQKADHSIQEINAGLTQVASLIQSANKTIEDMGLQKTVVQDIEQRAKANLALIEQEATSIASSSASSKISAAEMESQRTRTQLFVAELDKSQTEFVTLVKNLSSFKQQTEDGLIEVRTQQAADYKTLDLRSQTEITSVQGAAIAATTSLSTAVQLTLKSSVENFGIESSSVLSKLLAAETARELKASTTLKLLSDGFSSEVLTIKEEFRKNSETATVRSNTLINDNEQRTVERFDELIKLENVIREKIRLATNFQLFHAFQTRQIAIAKGKDIWRYALFGFVALSFLLSISFIIYLSVAHPTYDSAFYLKLSISLPLIYAIHFCSTEYSSERKLEEEYAFKGNISISLEPYRELVEKMIDKGNPAEAAKYSDFVIASIGQVFTSPTQQTFRPKESKVTTDEVSDTSKGINKILGSISELMQSLAKFK